MFVFFKWALPEAPCNPLVHENEAVQRQRYIPQAMRANYFSSYGAEALRVQPWTSAQPPTATSPQLPCLERGGGHTGHVSTELLCRVPLAHRRECKGAYCCLRSPTHPTALQGQSLQSPRGILPAFVPIRPRQHSIDDAYLNFRIRPLDANQHTCPGKACRLH